MNNQDYLTKALDKLGFKYQVAKDGQKLTTKGHYGVHEQVDILLDVNNQSVGFQKQADGTYTAVGDFYSLRDKEGNYLDAGSLKCEVTASAKQAEINERLMAMDFSTESCLETKQEIRMSFDRWVA